MVPVKEKADWLINKYGSKENALLFINGVLFEILDLKPESDHPQILPFKNLLKVHYDNAIEIKKYLES